MQTAHVSGLWIEVQNLTSYAERIGDDISRATYPTGGMPVPDGDEEI